MRNSLLTCLVRATLARERFHALEIWHNVYPGVGRVREYFTACSLYSHSYALIVVFCTVSLSVKHYLRGSTGC